MDFSATLISSSLFFRVFLRKWCSRKRRLISFASRLTWLRLCNDHLSTVRMRTSPRYSLEMKQKCSFLKFYLESSINYDNNDDVDGLSLSISLKRTVGCFSSLTSPIDNEMSVATALAAISAIMMTNRCALPRLSHLNTQRRTKRDLARSNFSAPLKSSFRMSSVWPRNLHLLPSTSPQIPICLRWSFDHQHSSRKNSSTDVETCPIIEYL